MSHFVHAGLPFPKTLPVWVLAHTWKDGCSENLSVKNVRERKSRWELSSRAITTTRLYTSV